MNEAGCIKEYESTKPRLLKGDLAELEAICKQLDELAVKKDGFLKYGINRATLSDAIHAGIECIKKFGVQPAPRQKRLSEV